MANKRSRTIIKKQKAGWVVFFKYRKLGSQEMIISKFGTHKTRASAMKEARTIRKLAGLRR